MGVVSTCAPLDGRRLAWRLGRPVREVDQDEEEDGAAHRGGDDHIQVQVGPGREKINKVNFF